MRIGGISWRLGSEGSAEEHSAAAWISSWRAQRAEMNCVRGERPLVVMSTDHGRGVLVSRDRVVGRTAVPFLVEVRPCVIK